MTDTRFTTIGHSNRSLDEILDMLVAADVRWLVDVRTFPRSRHNPVFNIDHFPDALAERQIGYSHIAALGGRRGRQRDVPEALNALWRESSFHNYADYALGDAFGDGFEQLLTLGADRRVALMCAEAMWWRCHRRIITDYLVLNGRPVEHLMTPGRTQTASPTPGSVHRPDGKVVYPAEASGDEVIPADRS
jgi:uncharacterized protein (DUF488 family)